MCSFQLSLKMNEDVLFNLMSWFSFYRTLDGDLKYCAQFIEGEIHDRIHRAKNEEDLLVQISRSFSFNSPIPNHQHQRRHQPSCRVLVLVRVCKLDGLLRPWVHLNVELRVGEQSPSELCASMSMERSLVADGGTDASIRCLRWSNT